MRVRPMVDRLDSVVESRTAISDRYRKHAAWQNMNAHLSDWVAARDRLDRAIACLDQMMRDRYRATEAGEWPPAKDTSDYDD